MATAAETRAQRLQSRTRAPGVLSSISFTPPHDPTACIDGGATPVSALPLRRGLTRPAMAGLHGQHILVLAHLSPSSRHPWQARWRTQLAKVHQASMGTCTASARRLINSLCCAAAIPSAVWNAAFSWSSDCNTFSLRTRDVATEFAARITRGVHIVTTRAVRIEVRP